MEGLGRGADDVKNKNMENTVFILGAGASKEGGAPLMGDFLDVAHRQWQLGQAGEEATAFQTVFKGISSLQDVHSKSELDINNVESIFTAFEMAKILNRFPRREAAEIDGMIQALKKVIAKTLETTLRFPVQSGRIHSPAPYDKFVKLLRQLEQESKPQQSISILTFNYDIAMDYALQIGGFDVNYGLRDGDKIPLLKLHGSLNWTKSVDTDAIIPYGVLPFLSTRQLQIWPETRWVTIPMSSSLRDLDQGTRRVTGEPLIVPPTWNKGDSHKSLTQIWARAAQALSQAENIFVIGYSLPPSDAFFRYLYALGTAGDVLLKRFWVFDPASEGVEQRFRTLLGSGARERFRYFRKTFSEAIDVIENTFPKAN